MAREYVRVLSKHQSFIIGGIVSKSSGSAVQLAQEYGILYASNSIGDLFAKCELDAVIVAVPELATRTVLEDVWAQDCICLVEKPAGINLAEAEYIALQVTESSHPTFVALNRRFYSSTARVKAALDSAYGPRMVDVFDQEDPAIALMNGTPKEVVDNWIFANSIHIVDLARMFVRGKYESVKSSEVVLGDNQKVVLSVISYSSGDVLRYLGAWNAPGPWGVHISNGLERLSLQPLEFAYRQGTSSRKVNRFPISRADRVFKPGLWRMICELDKQLEKGTSDLPTVADSLESMSLIAHIYEEYGQES